MIADGFIVLLLLISGLIMLLADMLILGVYFVGILGVIFIATGSVLSHVYFGNEIGMSVVVGSIALTISSLYYSLNRRTWEFIASKKDSQTDNFEEQPQKPILNLGQEGITLSPLRPVGTAQFGNDSFEVRTFGKYLDNNSIVYIAKIDRRKIYVKAIASFKAS